MTTQMQDSEVKLHTLQVQEMYEKRRRELADRLREEETNQCLEKKDHMLTQLSLELNETRDKLGMIANRGGYHTTIAIIPTGNDRYRGVIHDCGTWT